MIGAAVDLKRRVPGVREAGVQVCRSRGGDDAEIKLRDGKRSPRLDLNTVAFSATLITCAAGSSVVTLSVAPAAPAADPAVNRKLRVWLPPRAARVSASGATTTVPPVADATVTLVTLRTTEPEWSGNRSVGVRRGRNDAEIDRIGRSGDIDRLPDRDGRDGGKSNIGMSQG